MQSRRSNHKSMRDPSQYNCDPKKQRQQYEHQLRHHRQSQDQLQQQPPPIKPHKSRQFQQPAQQTQQHHYPLQRSQQQQQSQQQINGGQNNQQNSSFSARPTKSPPMCNMATTVSYPTGANNCEMIGWHVANMDAKLNALFATMSEIYKDTAILAGESAASAGASMRELVEPDMFTMLQRESSSWDPSIMNEKRQYNMSQCSSLPKAPLPDVSSKGPAASKDDCGSGGSGSYCGTAPGKIITAHSMLMLTSVCLAGGMLCLSRDTSQLVFSLVMCCIATVLLLLWLSMCCRSYRTFRSSRKPGCQQAASLAAAAAGKGDSASAIREV